MPRGITSHMRADMKEFKNWVRFIVHISSLGPIKFYYYTFVCRIRYEVTSLYYSNSHKIRRKNEENEWEWILAPNYLT